MEQLIRLKKMNKMITGFKLLFFILIFLSYPTLSNVSPDIQILGVESKSLELLMLSSCFKKHLTGVGQLTEDRVREMLNDIEAACEDDAFFNEIINAYRLNTKAKASSHGAFLAGAHGTNSNHQRVLETDALTNPLLDQNKNIVNSEGDFSFWFMPRLSFDMGAHLAVSLAPLVQFSNNSEKVNSKIYEANVKVGLNHLEFQAGNFNFSAGRGKSGSLLFGSQHGPLTGFKLSNTSPQILPWVFKYFGPIQFNIIFSKLDKNQLFPNSNLIVERLDIKPLRFFEFGFSQAVVLGGEGAPNVGFRDGLKEIGGYRTGNLIKSNFSNRGFSADTRFTWDIPAKLDVYGEVYFEDCCAKENTARDMSNLIGAGALLNANKKKIKLNFEWVRTTEITYRNSTFKSGLVDHNQLLGHSIGPDAMGFYIFSKIYELNDTSYDLQLAVERRGRTQKNQNSVDIRGIYPGFVSPETRVRIKGGYMCSISSDLWINPVVGYEYVSHVNYGNQSKHHILGQITAGLHF